MLMLRDLLLSPKGIQGGGQLKRELLQHEARLRCLYTAACPPSSPFSSSSTAAAGSPAAVPRYLRVSLRLWTREAAAQLLRQRLSPQFWVKEDPLSPCVLALPAAAAARLLQQQQQQQGEANEKAAGWSQQLKQQQPQMQGLETHALVPEGFLALQDRASCTAAAAAAVSEGDIVIDACAAPGSKTLHVLGRLRVPPLLLLLLLLPNLG